jgi:hypothetical protein
VKARRQTLRAATRLPDCEACGQRLRALFEALDAQEFVAERTLSG